jgi:hypothetical protein
MKKKTSTISKIKIKVKSGTIGKTSIKEVSFVDEVFCLVFNSQHIFLTINNFERSFFIFLCEKMNTENEILIDGELIEEYREFLKKVTSGKKIVTIRTINNYLKVLVNSKLMIKSKKFKMLYIVNPKYAHKCSKSDRKKLLYKLINNPEKYDIDINALLDSSIL